MERRARVGWIVGGILVAALIAVIIFFAVRGFSPSTDAGSPSASASASRSATPSAVPVASPAATTEPTALVPESDATEIILAPLAGLSQALSDPAVPVDLAAVAQGLALGDFQAEIADFEQQGVHQVGTPMIISATVIQSDLVATPPTATVNVCLDRSDVQILDAQGTDVRDPAAPTRILTLWSMALIDGSWKLTDRTFTDQLTC